MLVGRGHVEAQAQPGTGQEASVGVRSGHLGLVLLALFTSQLLAFSPQTSPPCMLGLGEGVASLWHICLNIRNCKAMTSRLTHASRGRQAGPQPESGSKG